MGEAGQVLDSVLPASGLQRTDVNITNVVPWRPKDNEFKNHEPWQIERGMQELDDLIYELRPQIIVAFGNEAAWATIPNWPGNDISHAHGIMERRGYFFKGKHGTWVLATLHPANVKYQVMPNLMLLDLDMRRLDLWLRGKLPRDEWPEIKVAREAGDLVKLMKDQVLATDIELKWGGREVLCVGFCGDDLEPVVVPDNLLPLAYEVLANGNPKVLHHGQFDIYMLQEEKGIPIHGQLHDTMFQHWALFPELASKEETGGEYSDLSKATRMTRKGLAFLMSMYGNWPWWKDYPDEDHPKFRELMFILNGRDCYATRWLHSLQIAKIYEEAVDEQYYEAMRMVPIAIKMQRRGMLVNDELRQKRIEILTERLTAAETDIVLAGLSYIWEHELASYRKIRSCPCCRGSLPGRKPRRKTRQCWSCAGYEKVPSKAQLVWQLTADEGVHVLTDLPMEEYLARREAWHEKVRKTKKAVLERYILKPCNFCGGKGYIGWYEFNPFSNQQLGTLLYDVIGVPKSLLGKKRQVDENTLGRVLHWARS